MPYRLSFFLTISLCLLCGPASAAWLAGSEWKPVHIGELAVPDESAAFIQFRSKGRLSGHGGCNRLMAEYAVRGDALFIGPVAATRMVCAESVMVREGALASALQRARTFRRQRSELVLFDAGGQPILELRQTDWD